MHKVKSREGVKKVPRKTEVFTRATSLASVDSFIKMKRKTHMAECYSRLRKHEECFHSVHTIEIFLVFMKQTDRHSVIMKGKVNQDCLYIGKFIFFLGDEVVTQGTANMHELNDVEEVHAH